MRIAASSYRGSQAELYAGPLLPWTASFTTLARVMLGRRTGRRGIIKATVLSSTFFLTPPMKVAWIAFYLSVEPLGGAGLRGFWLVALSACIVHIMSWRPENTQTVDTPGCYHGAADPFTMWTIASVGIATEMLFMLLPCRSAGFKAPMHYWPAPSSGSPAIPSSTFGSYQHTLPDDDRLGRLPLACNRIGQADIPMVAMARHCWSPDPVGIWTDHRRTGQHHPTGLPWLLCLVTSGGISLQAQVPGAPWEWRCSGR